MKTQSIIALIVAILTVSVGGYLVLKPGDENDPTTEVITSEIIRGRKIIPKDNEQFDMIVIGTTNLCKAADWYEINGDLFTFSCEYGGSRRTVTASIHSIDFTIWEIPN